jgi:hypothetical protein
MSYSKAKLKSSGDKSSPCFNSLWIAKLSGYLLVQILLYVEFKQILIGLGSFMDISNSMRILYYTSRLYSASNKNEYQKQKYVSGE